MRNILYRKDFTPKDPFFRIGNEGVGVKELLLGMIDAEFPDDLKSLRFGNYIITDLDTFNKTASAAQRREVQETLKLFSNVG